MNKLSTEKIETTDEKTTSSVDYGFAQPFNQDEIDRLVRNARAAQVRVAGQLIKQMFKAVFKFIGKIFDGIDNGMRSAAAYNEIARLSDRDLADIGISRDQIASVVVDNIPDRSAKTNKAVYGHGVNIARPSNDWIDNAAA